MCSSSPEQIYYGSRGRDLIGQLECALEVRIGWEPHAGTRAHAHAHLVFPGHRHMRALINGVYKFSTRFQWCGRHNLMNVVDEIELIAQRVFGSLTTHVNKMNWAIYNNYPLK